MHLQHKRIWHDKRNSDNSNSIRHYKSELTGGKFANGAVTGAFVHLFNNMANQFVDYRDPNKVAFGDRKEDRMFESIGNKVDDINKKSIVGPIYNGLSRDIPKAYNNAHPAIQMCLDVSLTIVEYGFTSGISQPFEYAYDFISGANFNTIPTSGAGWAGKAYDEFAR